MTNMTINNWVTLAQDYLKDTSVGVSTVFPAATTADWEDFIDPISIDLDAAEVDIADHESRIDVLEAASGGAGELANLTLLTATSNSETVTIPVDTVGLVLIAHDNLSGINVYLPAMNDRDIILVKNLNLADAGDEAISLHAHTAIGESDPDALFDGRWSTIELKASSNANSSLETHGTSTVQLCGRAGHILSPERFLLSRQCGADITRKRHRASASFGRRGGGGLRLFGVLRDNCIES